MAKYASKLVNSFLIAHKIVIVGTNKLLICLKSDLVTLCDCRIVLMDQQFTPIQSIKPLSHAFIPALVLPTHSATIYVS